MEKDLNNTTLLEGLTNLCNELEVSRDAYFKLRNSSEYPHLEKIFSAQYEQRLHFLKVLRDEYTVLSVKKVATSKKNGAYIYSDFTDKADEQNFATRDLQLKIINNEIRLIEQYRNLLRYIDLPNTTAAILQSQAEKINANIEQFKLDHRTLHLAKPKGVVKKHQKSQIRTIMD